MQLQQMILSVVELHIEEHILQPLMKFKTMRIFLFQNVQNYLKTKDDSLLQEGIAAAPDFARDFLSLLASQNMHLPPSRG